VRGRAAEGGRGSLTHHLGTQRPPRDNFRCCAAPSVAGRFAFEVVDKFPSLKLRPEFSRIQQVSGIHVSNIWIGVEHRNDGNHRAADTYTCTNNWEEIALEVTADDNQIVRLGLNHEFVTFEIREDDIYGNASLQSPLLQNVECDARRVHCRYGPPVFAKPDRMASGTAREIQSRPGNNLSSEVRNDRVRFVNLVFAFAVATVPIRHVLLT
jgi:hypothetical protein